MPMVNGTVKDRMARYPFYPASGLYEDIRQEAILALIEFMRSDKCKSEKDITDKARNHIAIRIYDYIAMNQLMSLPRNQLNNIDQIIQEEYSEELDKEIYSGGFENLALINVVTDMMKPKYRHYAKFLMEGFYPTSYNEYFEVPYTTTLYWINAIRRHFEQHGYSPFGDAQPLSRRKKTRGVLQEDGLPTVCPT